MLGGWPDGSFALTSVTQPSTGPTDFLRTAPVALPVSLPLMTPISTVVSFDTSSDSSKIVYLNEWTSVAFAYTGSPSTES